MSIPSKPLVASLVWKLPSQLHKVQAETVQALGYPHQFFRFDEPFPEGTDIVLVQGPYGSLAPLARRLREAPPERRPALVYWFQQSMQLVEPEPLNRFLSLRFSELHQLDRPGWAGRSLQPLNHFLNSKGARLGFFGDILWLHRQGLLDVLALTSTVYASYLEALGVPSTLIQRGYHPSYGSVLNQERDIAAVWMGKLRTPRRRKAIHWLRAELQRHGQSMQIYDGQENDFIHGPKRTEILNRAWFVINVFFSGPKDELSIRYFVAASNGAVVLSEPGANRYPFVPGSHMVVCPVEKMPATILYYLEHKEEWCQISANMLNLIQNEYPLERSIQQILTQGEAALEQRNGIR